MADQQGQGHGRSFNYIANVGMMWSELAVVERFAAARAAGFEVVEMGCAWSGCVATPSELAAAAAAAGVSVYAINTPKVSRTGIEWGTAAVADAWDEFEEQLDETLAAAAALGAQAIHVLAGCGSGASRDAFVAALVHARAQIQAKALDLDILIEPINDVVSIAGYFLTTVGEALAVIDAVQGAPGGSDGVSAPRVGLQLDVFHVAMQCSVSDAAAAAAAVDKAVALALGSPGLLVHIQWSSPPSRAAPACAANAASDADPWLDFAALADQLDTLGYTGFVGLEYKPTGGSTLDEIVRLRAGGCEW